MKKLMILGNQQQFGDVKKQTWRCNKPTPQWGLVCRKTFLETGNHDSIRDLAKNIKEQWWFGEVFDRQKWVNRVGWGTYFGEDPEFLLDDFTAILWRSLFLIFCEVPDWLAWGYLPHFSPRRKMFTHVHTSTFLFCWFLRDEKQDIHIFSYLVTFDHCISRAILTSPCRFWLKFHRT